MLGLVKICACLVVTMLEIPNHQAEAHVIVNVNRNPNAPEFIDSNVHVSVDETHGVGTTVLDVNATDSDYGFEIPNHQADAFVTMNLNRNPDAPKIISSNYFASIDETHGVRTRVLNINATDSDNEIITYGKGDDWSDQGSKTSSLNKDDGIVLSRKLQDII